IARFCLRQGGHSAGPVPQQLSRTVISETRGAAAAAHRGLPSLFLSRDEECERLVLVARLPEGRAHLFDGIRRGKQFFPCLRLHSSVDGGTFIFFIRILMRLHRHFHMTGSQVQKLGSQFVAVKSGEAPNKKICPKSRKLRIKNDRREPCSGNKVTRS